MQRKFFVWHDASASFTEVDHSTFEKVQSVGVEGFINNTIDAHKETDDDTTFWRFDVALGNATGSVIAEVVKVARVCQGVLLID